MSGQSGGGDGGGGRICLANLNDQLTCKLCNGYFIDATTIIECLHSFCRSCIVKYLESNKYCPICEVQVHKSKPLLNIRPDHTLQDIVYKLVPGCYQNEMRCRREFYEKHPEAQLSTMSPEARGEPIESHIYSPDEVLTLSLEYYNPNYTDTAGVGVVIPLNETKELTAASISSSAGSGTGIGSNEVLPRRYLRCPAAVTVFHLQKLIRAKNGLSDVHRVDIMYKEESLCGNYTLMDVMYIYHWRRKVPLHLSYRIFESSPKRLKLSEDNVQYRESLSKTGINFVPTTSSSSSTSSTSSSGSSTSPTTKESIKSESKKDEWKEVQLKISETGETSVTVITNSDLKKLSKSGSSTYSRSNDSQTKNSVKTEPSVDTNSKKTEDKSKNSEESNSKPNNSEVSVKPEKDKSKNEKSEAALVSASGSKIDALSVKLQFQPKVGQVNNTYSKRTPKEKTKVTITENKLMKKSDARLLSDNQKLKSGEKSRAASSSTSTTTTTSKPLSFTLVSFPQQRNAETADKEPPTNKRKNDVNYNPRSGLTITTTTCTSSSSSSCTMASGKNSRQNSSNEISNDSSTPGYKSSHPTFPYTVQDLVSNAKKSSTKPSDSPLHTPAITYSITTASTTTSSSLLTSGSGAKTPIYTSPCNNKSNDVNSNASKTNSNTNNNNINNINQSGGSTIIVPPCPDAIPISLMKPTVRKTEILTKGTNLNEICAKIGGNAAASATNTSSTSTGATPSSSSSSSPSGSKINDICAKIGENTKEKNSRLEIKSRPEIPNLLKITKKSMSSTNTNDINTNALIKHIANIPNVPIYTPSLSVSELRNSSGSGSTTYSRDYLKMSLSTPSITVTTTTSTSPSINLTPTTSSITITPTSSMVITAASPQHQNAASFQRKRGTPKNNTGNSGSGSGSGSGSSMSNYKTLREPPKSWNPVLSKNNYVAVKNQAAKEMQNQTQSLNAGSEQNDSKSIASKSAKIFKMRNVPRFLGNPASGVKPMYNINESKDKDSSSSLSTAGNTKINSSGLSMTKIDPKTLSPITITSRANSNSPIITPPPYSPNTSSSYQNTPFSRSGVSGSTTGSNTSAINTPLSPRNSPVNLLSTSPFIPSQTPNTNPRLIYAHHFNSSMQPPPQYSNADLVRFSTNPLIRTNLSCLPPAPNAAFHSSLPPAISKYFQRTTSYIPHTTTVTYSQQGLANQSVGIQRISPSINNFTTTTSSSLTSTASKTSKTTTVANSQSFNSAKTESNREIGNLIKTSENSAFNLSTAVTTVTSITTPTSSSLSTSSSNNYASDLSKNSPTKASSDAKSSQSLSKNVPCDSSSKGKTESKDEQKKEEKDKDKDKDKEKDKEKEDKLDQDKSNKDKDKDKDKTEEIKGQSKQEDDKVEEEMNKVTKKKVKDDKKSFKRLKKDDEEEKKEDIESKEEITEALKVNGSSTSATSNSTATESVNKSEEQTTKDSNLVKDDTTVTATDAAAVTSTEIMKVTEEPDDKEKKITDTDELNNKNKEVKINKSTALNSE